MLTVRDDGAIAPYLIHEIPAAGNTPEGLREMLVSRYDQITYDPVANRQRAEVTSYLLQVGDEIEVRFELKPEMSDRVIIRPDGRISHAQYRAIDQRDGMSDIGQVMIASDRLELLTTTARSGRSISVR